MAKKSSVLLLHVRDAISQIEVYVDGWSYDDFAKDKKTQDAVVRQLEIIGEAAKNLEKIFSRQTTDVSWREIADFRNVLAHEYWDVDVEIVWETICQDLPVLKTAIHTLIHNSTE